MSIRSQCNFIIELLIYQALNVLCWNQTSWTLKMIIHRCQWKLYSFSGLFVYFFGIYLTFVASSARLRCFSRITSASLLNIKQKEKKNHDNFVLFLISSISSIFNVTWLFVVQPSSYHFDLLCLVLFVFSYFFLEPIHVDFHLKQQQKQIWINFRNKRQCKLQNTRKNHLYLNRIFNISSANENGTSFSLLFECSSSIIYSMIHTSHSFLFSSLFFCYQIRQINAIFKWFCRHCNQRNWSIYQHALQRN